MELKPDIVKSPFIKKIADGTHLSSFGNDRAPFYSQYDREQAEKDDRLMHIRIQSTLSIKKHSNASMRLNKPIVYRPGNFNNHPALMQKTQKRILNSKSSIVGPTIKSGSRLA